MIVEERKDSMSGMSNVNIYRKRPGETRWERVYNLALAEGGFARSLERLVEQPDSNVYEGDEYFVTTTQYGYHYRLTREQPQPPPIRAVRLG